VTAASATLRPSSCCLCSSSAATLHALLQLPVGCCSCFQLLLQLLQPGLVAGYLLLQQCSSVHLLHDLPPQFGLSGIQRSSCLQEVPGGASIVSVCSRSNALPGGLSMMCEDSRCLAGVRLHGPPLHSLKGLYLHQHVRTAPSPYTAGNHQSIVNRRLGFDAHMRAERAFSGPVPSVVLLGCM
jgi:hypothetical protein